MAEKKFTAVGIERHDKHNIVLPEGMGLREGAKWLVQIDNEREEFVAIFASTGGHPLDGAHALALALSERYGHAKSQSKQTMFGAIAPTNISVPVDANGTTKSVPWGELALPGVEGHLETGMQYEGERPVFVVRGEVKKRYEAEVNEVLNLMRTILAERSIYRGKAVRLKFPPDGSRPDGNPTKWAPEFIDVSGASLDKVVLNRSIERQVIDYVLTPIRFPDGAKRLGMGRKRGVLFHGTYGTGKSLTSRVIANEATSKGMTFIYLEDATRLAEAYRFAMDYSPAVLFVEDVDKVTSGDERTVEMNAILNILDGIESKATEVMTVFTTNELHSIHKAFDRPGRIDVMIEMAPPDAEAAARLVALYAGGSLDPTTDMEKIGNALAGNIPALISEAVNRSKYSAMARANGDVEHLLITAEDIELASESLATARNLLRDNSDERSPSVLENIGAAAVAAIK